MRSQYYANQIYRSETLLSLKDQSGNLKLYMGTEGSQQISSKIKVQMQEFQGGRAVGLAVVLRKD